MYFSHRPTCELIFSNSNVYWKIHGKIIAQVGRPYLYLLEMYFETDDDDEGFVANTGDGSGIVRVEVMV